MCARCGWRHKVVICENKEQTAAIIEDQMLGRVDLYVDGSVREQAGRNRHLRQFITSTHFEDSGELGTSRCSPRRTACH